MNEIYKEILQLSALILSIINALMLLRHYLRDRAQLQVKPIRPEDYQWWFRLPEYKKDGEKIKGYGYLIYVTIGNRGLRKVSLESWCLHINDSSRKEHTLKPISIPEPSCNISLPSGDTLNKTFQVLGMVGNHSAGVTTIDSGCFISGWAYYVAEFPKNSNIDILIEGSKTIGIFQIKDMFGRKAKAKISFSEIPLDLAKYYIKGIEILH